MKSKKRAKFNKCIDHSDMPSISTELVSTQNLDLPIGLIFYHKFDW